MPRILTGNDETTERAVQQGLVTRIANRQADELRKAIKDAMKRGAKAYEQDRSDTGVRAAVEEVRPRINRQVDGMYEAAWETLGRRVFDAFQGKSSSGAGEFKQENPEEAFQERLRQFVAAHSARQIERVMRTTNEQLRRIITNAEREGVGIQEVARRIRSESDTLSRVRSEVIARTEVHNAGQAAQQAAAKSTPGPKRKEWVAALDGRTRDGRFSHVDADGETVRIDEPFVRTGEDLDHPGDPLGSAGNIILCRCSVAYIVD